MSTPALATADLVERLTRSLAQAEREKAALRAQLEQVTEKWHIEVAPTLSDAKAREADLRREADKAQARADALEAQLEQAQTAYSSLVTHHETLQARVAKADAANQAALRRLSETHNQLHRRLAERDNKLSRLHEMYAESVRSLRATTLQAHFAKIDVANRSTIRQLREINQGLSRQLAERDNKLSRLHGMYAEAMRSLRADSRASSAPEKVSLTPPPVYVTYALLPSVDINNLVGATTTEPYGQQMLDVFAMIKRVLSPPINTPLPKGLGDSGARTITVVQDSPADIALAGFPSLVHKVS